MNRRHVLRAATAGALLPALVSGLGRPAWAANPAEDFVSANIHRGFDILNDHAGGDAARRDRFAAFLLGLTDVRRVALFLLGRYAANASADDLDAYVAAYQDYILAVYQSYFAKYAGQTLRVLDSRERAPDDYIVRTNIVGTPTEISFRVRTDGARPVLVDLSVAGVWLALAERDEFQSVLALNKGDIKLLSAHLRDVRKLY
jgi:phospholipid transport system substrate-binding protein